VRFVSDLKADPDQLLLDLLMSPEGRRDPYPLYRELRQTAPVHRSSFGALVLSRYDDCLQALRDPRLGRGNRGARLAGSLPDELLARQRERQQLSMLFANPPAHTRLRRLVSREFTPARVLGLRPAIEAMVARILDGIADRGEVDVMAELAFPLPVTVIGELLGVPEADRAGFQPLVRKTIVTLEFNADEAGYRAAAEATDEMGAYFADLLAKRRRDPQGDLLSALAAAPDADDRLTEPEVVATALLLFAAGFETTTNLIGNGLHALLSHPEQMAALRTHPDDAPAAVEEILRWDSPVQLNGRVALAPAFVAGHDLQPGDWVMCLQGAANRDPGRFSEPESFDVRRDGGAPLSFGNGIHYCLGAGLARAEGDVVLRALLNRFVAIEPLDPNPPWRSGLTLRGLAELPVRVTPR
jgi:cytochrome P450